MKKLLSSIFPVFLLLLAAGVSAQPAASEPSNREAQFELPGDATFQLNQRDSLERWEERVYVHTDRKQFAPGEHVFFKAYIVNRKSRQRWSPSKVLKLELRDAEEKVVDKQYHALSDGVSEGAFALSNKLEEGSYQLLAYTRWMQNYGEDTYFKTPIHVGSDGMPKEIGKEAGPYEISFFPEGGKLLAGISNRMVVYATTEKGNAVDFEAVITDGSPEGVIPVKSYGEGVGQVTFIPIAATNYLLRLQDGREWSLPEVQRAGYTLKVNNLDPRQVFVQSERQGRKATERIYVQGWINNMPCFENELSYNDQGIAKLEVSKAGLPTGRVDFRLVDENGLALAARPVWITAADQLDIQIEKVNPRKAKSDQHTFKVIVKDRNGQPVQTDLSMSVLANTDEQATFHFQNNGRTARFLEDLQVFSKSGTIDPEPSYPEEIVYPFQEGLEIVGYAYDLNNELLINRDIQLLGVSDSLWLAREVQTDATGLLRIQDLDFEGDTQLIFRAKGDDTRERLVKVVPLSEAMLDKNVKPAKKARKMKNMVVETTPWQPLDTAGVNQLAQVTVTGIKKPKQEYSTQYQSMISKQDIIVQDPSRPRSLLQMINELPGVNVVGMGSPNPRIQILRRGGPSVPGPPLWVLDGIPLNQTTNPALPTNLFLDTAVGLVSGLAVDRVEFLFGPAAAMYGTRGAAGVFLVYTRDGGDSDYLRRKDGQLKFKGFAPQPDISKVLREQLKNRKSRETAAKTLYWNPNLQTDEQGQVVVQIQSRLDYQQLELHVESITASGLKGSQKQVFSVDP